MKGNVITEPVDERPDSSHWKDIKDAIRGTEADYTKININKAILLL